jgi:hypothetical protein
LHRYRLIPDEGKYPDLRGFADWHHREKRHVIAWWGLWRFDGAPTEWCLCDAEGKPVALDPENPDFQKQLQDDVHNLISPNGYDIDGFFIDFTGDLPCRQDLKGAGHRWGIELLHHYLKIIHDAAKNAKPDAMMMTHCPNIETQARYRVGIARAVSDWLVNTDNWPLYDLDQWREYQKIQPELGIPASWYAQSFWGGYLGMSGGSQKLEAITEEDYTHWRETWKEYRRKKGLS